MGRPSDIPPSSIAADDGIANTGRAKPLGHQALGHGLEDAAQAVGPQGAVPVEHGGTPRLAGLTDLGASGSWPISGTS